MKIKKCCDNMEDEVSLYVHEDGTITGSGHCCGCSFQDWRFCRFCGKRYELEVEIER